MNETKQQMAMNKLIMQTNDINPNCIKGLLEQRKELSICALSGKLKESQHKHCLQMIEIINQQIKLALALWN